jgi:Zn finger protein HypA/HybF involved in hydrogenase expression
MTMRGMFKRMWWLKSRMSLAHVHAECHFDDAEIDIACPKCGHEIKQTVGWLHTYDEVGCPRCRKRFRVDSTQAIRALGAHGHKTDSAPYEGFDPKKPL